MLEVIIPYMFLIPYISRDIEVKMLFIVGVLSSSLCGIFKAPGTSVKCELHEATVDTDTKSFLEFSATALRLAALPTAEIVSEMAFLCDRHHRRRCRQKSQIHLHSQDPE